MKKIILSLTCVFILNSCKQKENTEESTKATDTTSSSAKVEDTPAIDCPKLETYLSCGEMITDSQADLRICLADPTKTKNTYKIVNVYNVSDSDGNKLVMHLEDLYGKDLRPENNYIFKYSLNFGIIKKAPNAVDLDIDKEIGVVVFHDNEISESDMKAKATEIYRLAQTNDCYKVKIQVGTKVSATDFRHPKTCGTGTIKPLTK
ncbi:hypothetical protein OX283_011600 [Flavobacterium sp. SUN052]|uniref:hypothetical protein n=1 Tax=Flavobacterium sp. SUN052 TaxID=3002441 RepID=UPI00237E9E6E|nr:hypothetical protein [Flavobacterium sp. SUN052]MEC4005302.1 hypothetical protein [Flavobacterium sp. SUN052]